MWSKPTKKQLEKIPALDSTEDVDAMDKKIYMHFFLGSCDWYIAEFDGTDTMFGFACLNGDLQMAEWGYISYSELVGLKVSFMEVDRDKHFKPCKAGNIELIINAMAA